MAHDRSGAEKSNAGDDGRRDSVVVAAGMTEMD